MAPTQYQATSALPLASDLLVGCKDETAPESSGRTVITFGTYDLFHYGHLRILERSAMRGDRLVVGVSSDALNWSKKQKKPAISDEQRMAIVGALSCVDEVFLEESLELKKEYCIKYKAHVLVMGDDHLNEYNEMLDGVCECEYLPRTEGVSSTDIKRHISQDSLYSMDTTDTTDSDTDKDLDIPTGTEKEGLSKHTSSSNRLSMIDENKPKIPKEACNDQYAASGKNLVRATKQSNIVTSFLVDAHDCYYDWVMRTFTPFARVMPRDVTVFGNTYTVFTANIVTYGRGFLAIAIALSMKFGWLWSAAFLVMFHDFLDHLDGVVAKQQALDGRSTGDDSRFGAFVDAQMDKLVFCLSLWSFILFLDYSGSLLVNAVIVSTCALLFALEFTIAVVRTGDYFTAKLTPVTDCAQPALRAVSEGKLKQKFESIGIALYCLCLPSPTSHVVPALAGTACLFFAAYYSMQSLVHKLNARAKSQ